MKAKTLYTCEICHTDYADKKLAEKCEKSHQTVVKKVTPLYKSMNMGIGKYPYKVEIEFGDGNKITYRT